MDRIHVRDILTKFNLPFVNQLFAQVKLNEAWKISKDPNYSVKKAEAIDKANKMIRDITNIRSSKMFIHFSIN